MKIGLIGAGNIGGALAHRFRELGHEVAISNSRGPASLADLAQETGATAVDVKEAARDKDVVVVTIPMKNLTKLPSDLFDGVPETTIVIDTNNYYPQQRDGKIAGIEDGDVTESGYVEKILGRPVVKVFNNIMAAHLQKDGKVAGTAGRIALPVSGDDAAKKREVLALVDDLGFDQVDNGSIANSWRQQPGSPCYTADKDLAGLKAALADASPERKPEWKAKA